MRCLLIARRRVSLSFLSRCNWLVDRRFANISILLNAIASVYLRKMEMGSMLTA